MNDQQSDHDEAWLSELFDGESKDCDAGIERLLGEEGARQRWRRHSVLRDCLRESAPDAHIAMPASASQAAGDRLQMQSSWFGLVAISGLALLVAVMFGRAPVLTGGAVASQQSQAADALAVELLDAHGQVTFQRAQGGGFIPYAPGLIHRALNERSVD